MLVVHDVAPTSWLIAIALTGLEVNHIIMTSTGRSTIPTIKLQTFITGSAIFY